MVESRVLISLWSLFLLSCSFSKPPNVIYQQYQLDYAYAIQPEKVEVSLKNTIPCPVRIWVQPEDSIWKTHFDALNPIVLQAYEETTLWIPKNHLPKSSQVKFGSRLGDLTTPINLQKVELPFLKGKEYTLIQGYNSMPTHNTDWSRYALDFGLAVGDTICSAADGFVVGVIEDYKRGGAGREWKDFGNFICIYHPSSGIFTQYAHLMYKGSFVEVGDKVKAGQKIGLAGRTGQTNIEHLHFNCLKPENSEAGLISIPIDSIGPYRTADLKRHQVIRNGL